MAEQEGTMNFDHDHPEDSEEDNNSLNELKKGLEGWREVLLPLNRVLNWDRPYHPAILIALTTFVFTLLWYFEPSVLTTFSLFGLIAVLVDFLVPIVGPSICTEKWTVVQEQQYAQVCERIMHFRMHVSNFRVSMGTLKVEKPKVYFMLVMGMLVFIAWIGSMFDNCCLTFFIVTFSLLVPGLRKHGYIQKYLGSTWETVKRFIMSKTSKEKKSN